MKDVMIDMETKGVGKLAVLLDIALVQFDIRTGEIGKTLHVVINSPSQEAIGREIDESTMAWWDRQKPEARDIIEVAENSGLDWYAAMDKVHAFLKGIKGSVIWSNGANFDIAILEEAFKRTPCLSQPWVMWKTRCVRTLHDIVKEITGDAWKKEVKPPIVAHNSVEDCLYQIRYCVEAYNAIRTNTGLAKAHMEEVDE